VSVLLLRDATADDAARIASIWHQGWRDGHLGYVPETLVAARSESSFVERATARVAGTTVLDIGDVVAGFVMVVDDEVEQVYVDGEYRGSGAATMLLAEAERQVRSGGHDVAWLAVVAGNARARRFYERQGWVDDGLFDYGAATADGDKANAIAVPSHRYTKELT